MKKTVNSFCWKATMENAPWAPFQRSRFYPNISPVNLLLLYNVLWNRSMRWIKVTFRELSSPTRAKRSRGSYLLMFRGGHVLIQLFSGIKRADHISYLDLDTGTRTVTMNNSQSSYPLTVRCDNQPLYITNYYNKSIHWNETCRFQK